MQRPIDDACPRLWDLPGFGRFFEMIPTATDSTMRPRRQPSSTAAELAGDAADGPVGAVVDLFCGAGGLSYGFGLEGFSVACGYDIDDDCRFPFEENTGAPFIKRDVTTLNRGEVDAMFAPDLPRILVGCAPCQPFSRYSQGRNDPKWRLLENFGDLAAAVAPDVITMENVPQLLRFKGGSVFAAFKTRLEGLGYNVQEMIADCTDFGVPQNRSRLVVVATRHGVPTLPTATHGTDERVTVAQAIGDLPRIEAGGTHQEDRLHRASGLSDLNMKRIRASRAGGTWRDWEPEMRAECHRKATGRSYAAVYARMRWDKPAPTLTTQFYGFGNGRFGHPEQDRALSLREGAILQSFPPDYAFVDPRDPIRFSSVGRLIGNAVPVLLARAIARAIAAHLRRRAS